MESQNLRELLEKYEAGDTSVGEERELKEYFTNNEVPANLKPYQFLFSFSESEREKKYEPEIHMTSKKTPDNYFWTAIAASILVVVGLFLFQNKDEAMSHSNLGTIENKEEALKKSMETLKMVSELMNEGKEDLVYLKEFNKTKNKFIKTE